MPRKQAAAAPFSTRVDPRRFRPHPSQAEALARLQHAVAERFRLVFLFGPAGSGKTLVQQAFGANCRQQGIAAATVNLTGVEPTEVAWSLLAEWGRNPEVESSPARLWRDLTDQLTEFRYQRRSVVLLADDADSATVETLQYLQRLLAADVAADSRFTLVLALDPVHRTRLPRRMGEWAELRIDLEPWSKTDTAEFLTRGAAGPEKNFTPDAVETVQTLTEGLPRRINQLARLVVLAAGDEVPAIGAPIVDAVQQELWYPR